MQHFNIFTKLLSLLRPFAILWPKVYESRKDKDFDNILRFSSVEILRLSRILCMSSYSVISTDEDNPLALEQRLRAHKNNTIFTTSLYKVSFYSLQAVAYIS